MPFDPTWPQNGQLIDAEKFREQFADLVTHDEVLASRNDAIAAAQAGSANNCNSVLPLSMNADADYNQAQLQEMIVKLNELINALQR